MSCGQRLTSNLVAPVQPATSFNGTLSKVRVDQFALAALDKPKRFKTRLQKTVYDGLQARRDAEEAELTKWIQTMGAMLSDTQENSWSIVHRTIQMMGAGKRAATLRNRVRAVRKYIGWLTAAFDLPFPTDLIHNLEHLQMKHSDQDNRGSLKCAHRALVCP